MEDSSDEDEAVRGDKGGEGGTGGRGVLSEAGSCVMENDSVSSAGAFVIS